MKIIWAVDALLNEPDLLVKIAAELKVWSEHIACEIEPVFVMSATQMRYPAAYFAEHIAELSDKVMELLIRKLRASGAEPSHHTPRLLVAKRESLAGSVATLHDYATASGAELIVLGCHTHGLKRMAFGSFCETLVLASDVPMLLVSNNTRIEPRIQTVLFPTDLLPESEAALAQAMSLAKLHRARIVLLHVSEYLAQHTDGTFGPAASYYAAVEADKAARLQQLAELTERCQMAGIEASCSFADQELDPATSILSAAHLLPGCLIAMVSHKGADEFPSFASTTRHVLRKADRPLWTYHRG